MYQGEICYVTFCFRHLFDSNDKNINKNPKQSLFAPQILCCAVGSECFTLGIWTSNPPMVTFKNTYTPFLSDFSRVCSDPLSLIMSSSPPHKRLRREKGTDSSSGVNDTVNLQKMNKERPHISLGQLHSKTVTQSGEGKKGGVRESERERENVLCVCVCSPICSVWTSIFVSTCFETLQNNSYFPPTLPPDPSHKSIW